MKRVFTASFLLIVLSLAGLAFGLSIYPEDVQYSNGFLYDIYYEVYGENKARILSYATDNTTTTLEIPAKLGGYEVGAINFAFWNNETIKAFTVAEDHPTFVSQDGVLFDKQMTTIMHCPPGLSGEYNIPDSVVSIHSYAFYNCSKLTAVNIPKTVASIGDSAFWGCSNLTVASIPDSVMSIGNRAFYECTGLVSVNIPENLTAISESLFHGCANLTAVTIPENVTSIGAYAFIGCIGLKSITLPNALTLISSYAFAGCDGLTELTIPESVIYIGHHAFAYCDGFTEIIIPSSVKYVGEHAFSGCKELKSVNIFASKVAILNNVFSDNSEDLVVTFKKDGELKATVQEEKPNADQLVVDPSGRIVRML